MGLFVQEKAFAEHCEEIGTSTWYQNEVSARRLVAIIHIYFQWKTRFCAKLIESRFQTQKRNQNPLYGWNMHCVPCHGAYVVCAVCQVWKVWEFRKPWQVIKCLTANVLCPSGNIEYAVRILFRWRDMAGSIVSFKYVFLFCDNAIKQPHRKTRNDGQTKQENNLIFYPTRSKNHTEKWDRNKPVWSAS